MNAITVIHSARKYLIFSLLTTAAIVLQACASAGAPAEKAKIKAIVLPYTSFGPFFIAQDEGFFSEQNLEVEFVRFDSGTSPLPLLAKGEVDVLGSGPSVGLFNALASGSDIRVVSDKGYLSNDGCTYMALLASKNWAGSGGDPAALKNVRVSIDPTNFEAFMFEKVLGENGLSLDDVSVQDVAPPALAEAVSNDAVDVISVGDPWIVRLVNSGSVSIWKPYQEVMPDMQFGFVLFGPTLVRDNPDAGTRFMAAYLKGVEQYNLGKTPRNLEIMAKYTQLDTETLNQACWPPMNSSGAVNVKTVDEFQAWAVGKGLLSQQVTDDQYWDPSFIEEAAKLLH